MRLMPTAVRMIDNSRSVVVSALMLTLTCLFDEGEEDGCPVRVAQSSTSGLGRPSLESVERRGMRVYDVVSAAIVSVSVGKSSDFSLSCN